MVVGCPKYSSGTGRIRIFAYANGDWVMYGADQTGTEANELFGTAVAISYDGSRIAAVVLITMAAHWTLVGSWCFRAVALAGQL